MRSLVVLLCASGVGSFRTGRAASPPAFGARPPAPRRAAAPPRTALRAIIPWPRDRTVWGNVPHDEARFRDRRARDRRGA